MSGSSNATQTYIVFLDGIPGADHANVSGRVSAILHSLGTLHQPQEVFDRLNGFSIKLNEQQAQRLRALGGVQSVEADGQVQVVEPTHHDIVTGMALTPTGNGYASSGDYLPWGISAVWNGKFDPINATNRAAGKFAFVIDTGISSSTNDLNVDSLSGYNWINGTANAADDNGHGTHVAGTIAALANGFGVVGIAPGATVVPLKVLDASGGGSLTNVISAINYTLNTISSRGIGMSSAVINLSLGSQTSYTSLDTAIRNAAGQGMRFSIAAGNNGSDVDGFTPARTGNHANVYTVSAVDSSYRMASWSNWDKLTAKDRVDNIDYADPGVNVVSLGMTSGSLVNMSGTSMASPHMAGILLAGSPSSGGLVTPYFSGTADPFALLS